MAVFNDTFTDTNGTALESHTPNTGTSWTQVWSSGAPTGFEIETNTAVVNIGLSDGCIYSANATYPSADYSAEAVNAGNTGDDTLYLFVRLQDQENMYAAKLVAGGTSQLYKKVTGTWTALGTSFTGPAAGSVNKLEIIGTTIKFYDDGVELKSVTDSDISAAGKAGIGAGGGSELVTLGDDASGQSWDTFVVTDLGSGGGGGGGNDWPTFQSRGFRSWRF